MKMLRLGKERFKSTQKDCSLVLVSRDPGQASLASIYARLPLRTLNEIQIICLSPRRSRGGIAQFPQILD